MVTETGKESRASKSGRRSNVTRARSVERNEKIRKLAEQIRQGTYSVEAREVAKAILRKERQRLLGGRRPRKESRHTA